MNVSLPTRVDQVRILDVAQLAAGLGVVVRHAVLGEWHLVQVRHQVRRHSAASRSSGDEQVVDRALRAATPPAVVVDLLRCLEWQPLRHASPYAFALDTGMMRMPSPGSTSK